MFITWILVKWILVRSMLFKSILVRWHIAAKQLDCLAAKPITKLITFLYA